MHRTFSVVKWAESTNRRDSRTCQFECTCLCVVDKYLRVSEISERVSVRARRSVSVCCVLCDSKSGDLQTLEWRWREGRWGWTADDTARNDSTNRGVAGSFRVEHLGRFLALEALPTMGAGVGLVYDERMCAHKNVTDASHPERPARIASIYDRLKAGGIVERCPAYVSSTYVTSNVAMDLRF